MAEDIWEEIGMSETHDFEANKEFVGTFSNLRTNVGPNKSNMYNFKTDKGTVGIWGNAVLDTKLVSIMPGDQAKIVYVGKVKSPKTNRLYRDYKVYLKRATITGSTENVKAEEVDIPF